MIMASPAWSGFVVGAISVPPLGLGLTRTVPIRQALHTCLRHFYLVTVLTAFLDFCGSTGKLEKVIGGIKQNST